MLKKILKMLFYNQVKREFTQASWKRGQTYFREERVRDVRLAGKDGNLVTAKVQGSDEVAYETAIVIARGTIMNSDCSCPAHRLYETHCKHVAALTIWMLERGSLLRSGIGDSDDGVAHTSVLNEPPADPEDHHFSDEASQEYLMIEEPFKAAMDVRIRRLIQSNPILKEAKFHIRSDRATGMIEGIDSSKRSFSMPVTLMEVVALREYAKRESEIKAPPPPVEAQAVGFVRGVFQNKVLQAISIEPALHYIDPETDAPQVDPTLHLVRQSDPTVWRNGNGVYLKILDDRIPVLQNIDSAKIVYQGKSALENLAKLLTHPQRSKIIFHPSVNVEVDENSLKLVSLSIGGKTDKSRMLTYEYSNEHIRFSSEELSELSTSGRLSSQYVWQGNKIYKLETSLTALSRYANRSGMNSPEDPKQGFVTDGFISIDDDHQHPLHPLAAYRLSLELGVENFVVDPEWKEFHIWRKEFEKKKTPALPKVDYGFTLRDYQINGLSWLWSLYHRGLSALLADDMGLGKTHQVLAFLSSLYAKSSRSKSRPTSPTLVVAPTSVVAAWSQKLHKYPTGLKWYIFHGKSRTLPDDKNVDIVLTTYGILQKESILRERSWHVVILDEAQAIKNASTISARASRELKAKYRIAMTGTPIENQSTDLWSIMEVLLPGYLGSLSRFKRLYGAGRDIPSAYQAQALKRLVSPFLLRRTKSQVLTELPEKTEEIVSCQMTKIQKKMYRAYLSSTEAEKVRENLQGSGKVDYASVLALLTRLKQVCDHPRLADLTSGKIKRVKNMDPTESGKWEVLEELLHEALGSNLKVVIFTQYLGMMDLIGHSLTEKQIGFTELRGDTSDRAQRLERFANDPECKVFICSLLAGGLGIDLTSASVCIHLDRWWNPAKENQATDRLHRFGQTRGVQVFKLQIPGTIEDRIAGIIESKKALSGALIEESPTGLKAFSRKELLDLLTAPPLDPADFSSDRSGSEGGSGGGFSGLNDDELDKDEIDDTEYTLHI